MTGGVVASATPGRRIVQVDLAGTIVFAVTAALEAVLLDHWTQVLGVTVALALFFAGCLAFIVGYAQALQRSRTEDISVASVFLLIGPSVPGPIKRALWVLLAAQVAVALVTASVRTFTPLAFGVLVPVFGLGLGGLWAARHGTFPPRPELTAQVDRDVGDEMEQNADHG